MKQGLPILVLSAVIACLASAMTSRLLAPAPARGQVVPAPVPRTDEELLARFEEHSRELRALRDRLAALESRPEAESRQAVEAVEADETSPEPGSRAAETAWASPGALPDTFVASVDAALREIRAEEERQAEAERRAARLARIEDRLARMTEPLGLSPYQVDELRTVLVRRETARDELRALDTAADRDLYRDRRRALEQETRASLAAILTPEQLEGYESLGDRRNRDGRDRRGGDGAQGGRRGDRGRGGG